MTLTEAKILVERVEGRLDGVPGPLSDLELSREYAEACKALQHRLGQCVRLMEGGSRVQALLMASEPPALLELQAVLGFSRQAEWLAFCRASGLHVATSPDKTAVDLLRELLASGGASGPTQELYREFRAAMVVRDEPRALEAVRAIVRLNPADADAVGELSRLERRVAEQARRQLASALAAGGEEGILAALARCEALDLSDDPNLEPARAVRSRQQARVAAEEVRELLSGLASRRESGLWQECGDRASRIRALVTRHGLVLQPAEAAEVGTALEYFEQQRRTVLERIRYQEALSHLADFVERLQTGHRGEAKRGLAAIEEDRLQLRKLYEAVQAFERPVPEATRQSVAQLAAALEAEAGRLRRLGKVRRTVILAAAVVLLAVAGWTGTQLYRAHAYTTALQELRANGSAETAKRTLEEIRNRQPILLRLPRLAAVVLETEQWLTGVQARRTAAEASLAELSKAVGENFRHLTPAEAGRMVRQLGEQLEALPRDAAEALRVDFAKADKALALWLLEQKHQRTAQLREALTGIESVVLSSALPPATLQERLQIVLPQVPGVQRALDEETPETALPADLRVEASAAVEKIRSLQQNLQALQTAEAALAAARELPQYQAALEALAAVPLPGSDLVQAAQKASLRRLDPQQLLGQLILPEAPEVWLAADGKDQSPALPYPEAPTDAERERLAGVIFHPDLAEVYEAKLVPPSAVALQQFSSGRRIFSRGPLERSENPSVQGANLSWNGTVYDPASSPRKVNFTEVTYHFQPDAPTKTQPQGFIIEPAKSKVSANFPRLGLKSLVDEDGARYLRSLFPVAERVRKAAESPAVVRAFVLQELQALARLRPGAWGTAWSPAWPRHLAELREAMGRPLEAGDWMLPSAAALNNKLEALLRRQSAVSYETQARLHRKLAAAARSSGLTYLGLAGVDGSFTPPAGARVPEGGVLWGFTADGTQLRPLQWLNPTKKTFEVLAPAAPLSPVLFVSGVGEHSVREAVEAVGLRPDQLPAYAPDLPPLFRPPTPKP